MNEFVLRFLNSFTGLPLIDSLIIFLAETLPWILILGLIVYAVWHWRRSGGLWPLAFIAASSIMAWLVSQVINYFYFSPRPFLVLTDLNQLIQHGANDSFPSGHATIFMALGASLYLVDKRLGNLYLISALLISLARVAAGIHWPTDILGGWVLAWLIVLLCRSLFPQALNRPDTFRAF